MEINSKAIYTLTVNEEELKTIFRALDDARDDMNDDCPYARLARIISSCIDELKPKY